MPYALFLLNFRSASPEDLTDVDSKKPKPKKKASTNRFVHNVN